MNLKFLMVLAFFSGIFVQAMDPADSLRTHPVKPFVIVLDAGHGGGDPGNLGSGLKEKVIALAVTKEVGKLLGQHRDVQVIYTRDDDTFVKLNDRARIANDAKADLFVSIHCNSVGTPRAHGIETFVLGLNRMNTNLQVVKNENSVILLEENYQETYAGFDPNDPASFATTHLVAEESLEESINAAVMVQQNLTNRTKFRDRGVKEGNLAVLRLSYMPSILIEIGFLTNPKEAKFLKTKNGQKITAQAIYSALYDYIKNRDSNSSVIEPQKNPVEVENDVTFKVQISASSRDLSTDPSNFNGLQEVSKEKNGVIIRYFAGDTDDYSKIKQIQKMAIDAGFDGAFIVAFKNGEKVDLAQVINAG